MLILVSAGVPFVVVNIHNFQKKKQKNLFSKKKLGGAAFFGSFTEVTTGPTDYV
jgi:hypothetical protein